MDFFISYLNDIIYFTGENIYLTIIIYSLFLILYATFSLPGLIVFFIFSGYLFGIYIGYFVSIISISFGSLVFFIFSKYFLKTLFHKYYKKYSQNINNYISNSSSEYIIIFRLIPGTPLMVQNIILSFLDISYLKFIITSILGFSPLILTCVIIGNKILDYQTIDNINDFNVFTFDFIILLFLIITIILIRIYFKHKKRLPKV